MSTTKRPPSNDLGDLTQLVSKTEMLRILECPVCTDVPFPPIFQCLKGHMICKNCKVRLIECPQCKAVLSETRNYIAEEIILSSLHACSYKEMGCEEILKGDSIELHMRTCKYKVQQQGKCPCSANDGCNSLIKLFDVTEHLVLVHRAKVYHQPKKRISYSIADNDGERGLWRFHPIILELDGKHFIANLISKNSTLCWSILLIGTEEGTQSYEAEISLQSDKGVKVTWNVPVCSITNRTLKSFAFEEPKAFKATCSWEDLKLIGLPSGDGKSRKTTFSTTYTISRKSN